MERGAKCSLLQEKKWLQPPVTCGEGQTINPTCPDRAGRELQGLPTPANNMFISRVQKRRSSPDSSAAKRINGRISGAPTPYMLW